MLRLFLILLRLHLYALLIDWDEIGVVADWRHVCRKRCQRRGVDTFAVVVASELIVAVRVEVVAVSVEEGPVHEDVEAVAVVFAWLGGLSWLLRGGLGKIFIRRKRWRLDNIR